VGHLKGDSRPFTEILRIDVSRTSWGKYQNFVPVLVTNKARPQISLSFTSRGRLSSGHFSFSIILKDGFFADAGGFFDSFVLVGIVYYE
jgi:hypothetical protein